MTIRRLIVNGRELARSGINPARYIGARYSTKCLALATMKSDHRPMLTLQLIWVTVWIQLPWTHADTRPGRLDGKSWGASLSLTRPLRRPLLNWGDWVGS